MSIALTDQDVVTVTRSPRQLRLVKPRGKDYYEVLRTKLKWGDATSAGSGTDTPTKCNKHGPV